MDGGEHAAELTQRASHRIKKLQRRVFVVVKNSSANGQKKQRKNTGAKTASEAMQGSRKDATESNAKIMHDARKKRKKKRKKERKKQQWEMRKCARRRGGREKPIHNDKSKTRGNKLKTYPFTPLLAGSCSSESEAIFDGSVCLRGWMSVECGDVTTAIRRSVGQ